METKKYNLMLICCFFGMVLLVISYKLPKEDLGVSFPYWPGITLMAIGLLVFIYSSLTRRRCTKQIAAKLIKFFSGNNYLFEYKINNKTYKKSFNLLYGQTKILFKLNDKYILPALGSEIVLLIDPKNPSNATIPNYAYLLYYFNNDSNTFST